MWTIWNLTDSFQSVWKKWTLTIKNQIKFATGNRRVNKRLMAALAAGCQKYARQQKEQKQMELNRAKLAQSIRLWQNENKKKKTDSFPFLWGKASVWP